MVTTAIGVTVTRDCHGPVPWLTHSGWQAAPSQWQSRCSHGTQSWHVSVYGQPRLSQTVTVTEPARRSHITAGAAGEPPGPAGPGPPWNN